jgi:hypothetical protein
VRFPAPGEPNQMIVAATRGTHATAASAAAPPPGAPTTLTLPHSAIVPANAPRPQLAIQCRHGAASACDLDERDWQGRTALAQYTEEFNLEAVKLLLDAGANPSIASPLPGADAIEAWMRRVLNGTVGPERRPQALAVIDALAASPKAALRAAAQGRSRRRSVAMAPGGGRRHARADAACAREACVRTVEARAAAALRADLNRARRTPALAACAAPLRVTFVTPESGAQLYNSACAPSPASCCPSALLVSLAAWAAPSVITKPRLPGSTLTSQAVEMQWDDSGASLYQVWVGSTQGAHDLGYFPSAGTTELSAYGERPSSRRAHVVCALMVAL